MSLEAEIQSHIKNTKVLVYSKTYCSYSAQTKNSLQQLNIPATICELDQIPNGDEVQAALQSITGQKSVPNIFIGGVHVGGNSDFQEKLSSGEVRNLLGNAGVEI
mmetsp:Transcript_34225/g.59892  ORF Transcript_34225/g.59892 Transcript_34225/m.59892 type:complete len:105 (-) Transcript_34225:1752-2066(-)